MKTEFWMTGATAQKGFADDISFYSKRIRQYIPFDCREIRTAKSKTAESLKEAESDFVLKLIRPDDYLILLDEKGNEFSSIEFAGHLQGLFNKINSRIIFLAGGAFGFSHEIYGRANAKLALSKMTFTHDMVRIIFLEQLYRSLTILNNHPYQH